MFIGKKEIFGLACSRIKVNLVLLCFSGHKVPVGNGDGPQPVLGHGLDDGCDQPVLVGRRETLDLDNFNVLPLADDFNRVLIDFYFKCLDNRTLMHAFSFISSNINVLSGSRCTGQP